MARDRRPLALCPGRGARSRRPAPRRHDAGTARRGPGLRQGDLRHEPAADYRLQRRLGAPLPGAATQGRTRGLATPGGRCHRPRKDCRRRLRLPRQRHQQPHRSGAESPRSDRHPDTGRIQRRHSGRGCGRNGLRGTRHRRRWLQPHPGAVHRSGRDEADLRPRPAHRGDPDLALPRYPWAAGAHGRRCGTPPRRDRGAGPVGPAGAHRQVGQRSAPVAARRCPCRRAARTGGGACPAQADDGGGARDVGP